MRRARLCVSGDAPRRRLASRIEEALRLAVLPGESEGRAYYFQRVRVTGLPPDGDRHRWLTLFQRALQQDAATAVHGAHPRADEAPAVFFRSRQEALEILLRRVLERRTVREWFWPMVLRGTEASAASADTPTLPFGIRAVSAIMEALRSTAAEWVAVAAALFGAPRLDTVRLLQAIPEAVAQMWVQEMDGGGPLPPPAKSIIPAPAQRAIGETLRAFGIESPRALWFAAMAVLHAAPAEMAAGTLLAHARLVLWNLDVQQAAEPAGPRLISPSVIPDITEVEVRPDLLAAGKNEWGSQSWLQASQLVSGPVPPALFQLLMEGVPTRAAGLFFLLNVLARIGMPEAIASGLAASNPDFLPRLLLRLARHSGVAPDDPIVVWLASLLDKESSVERLERQWAVAVRRWCWRTGKITVREIVSRQGTFTVNHTDLDVSLPIDEAEIRIRRVGLDLDPGWLPWFGRVVRFHYPYRRHFDG